MVQSFWIGIVIAILASLCLNVGKGLQKWKVKVWAHGRAVVKPEHRKDLGLWFCGFMLTASASPLFSVALNCTDKSSMVSALNGVGLIGLVIFAWLVLREKIGWQELAGAALVLAGTVVVGYFNQPSGAQHYSLPRFLTVVAVIAFVMTPLAIFAWKTNKFFGLIMGALPGILIGVAMILADMALVKSGGSILGQLKNGYPYAAIAVGAGALVLTQFAFWRAKAMVVVPTINSFIVFTPVVIEYFTFGTVLKPVQYAAILAIIGGVILLTATETQEKI